LRLAPSAGVGKPSWSNPSLEISKTLTVPKRNCFAFASR
jgi:hypothetical protein